MRYILALIPSQPEMYIQAAETVFGGLTDGYLLSQEGSYPHITLASFSSEEEELREIWNEISEVQSLTCPVKFLGLHLKKGSVPPFHYSVGLSVARELPILRLHDEACKILRSRQIDLLNPSYHLYQPHLTLAGISWHPEESILLSPLVDRLLSRPVKPFRLALALGDDIGQYLETLYEQEVSL